MRRLAMLTALATMVCGAIGPIASATSLPKYVKVPDVRGYDESEAKCLLVDNGLRWRYKGFGRVYSTAQNCPAGSTAQPDPTVISQSRRAGARVRYRTVVVIDTDCNKLARGKTNLRCA